MAIAINPKERQHLAELHARFHSGTFSETDVSAFLVLLREQSGGGAIKELAHSIAHSERNSGEFFRRVRENQSLLNDLGKRSGILDGRYLFSGNDFAGNLNDALRKHGYDELQSPIPDLIFLCALSLLQNGSVKGGKTFGELQLSVTNEHFELVATMPIEHQGKQVRAAFPLAAVANRWLPICNPRAHLNATAPVIVKVESGVPTVRGFKPFEVYIERDPRLSRADLEALTRMDARITLSAAGVVFTPGEGVPLQLTFDGERLTLTGHPDFFFGQGRSTKRS